MSDPPVFTRLASVYFEDLAIIALTARCGRVEPVLYPTLDDKRRSTLRSRLKLISRYDWPSNQKEDPDLRRGYTLRQCCRLIVALLLIDSGVPPAAAISIASNNEFGMLRAILNAQRTSTYLGECQPTDEIAVIIKGDIWEQVDELGWNASKAQQVRFVARHSMKFCWSDEVDLGSSGQRILIDISTAARAVFHWLVARRLVSREAVNAFWAEIVIHSAAPAFQMVRPAIPRR